MDGDSYKLRLYSDVTATKVEWIWYPYIPVGKITVLQGDPGCGKSYLMMKLIAALSNGKTTPDGRSHSPLNVIYQCTEDGSADTIKPRLERAGADCSRVAFLEEDLFSLTLDSDDLRDAIAGFRAKLIVIDPFQAYLGDADLSSATGIRRIMRKLGMWASTYDCSFVLIGHLNKKQNSRELYRGLGSIDVIAAARSVLQVDQDEDADYLKVVRHIKSSLAPKGADVRFSIDPDQVVRWIETPKNEESTTETHEEESAVSKQEKAAQLLKKLLKNSPVKATEIKKAFADAEISERTMYGTKKTLGIKSFRKDKDWYWKLEKL